MQDKLFVEERKLVKRWNGPWPLILNTIFILLYFMQHGGYSKTLEVLCECIHHMLDIWSVDGS